MKVSILILLDYLFLWKYEEVKNLLNEGFNPYFTGLPILIFVIIMSRNIFNRFNPYFTGLPILILGVLEAKDYASAGFNPYFTGLPILINGIQKIRHYQ